MLTAEDKKYIQETVTNAQTDLIEKVLIPYFDQLHQDNKAIVDKLEGKIELIGEHLQDHEKRISKLEVRSGL